MLTDQRPERVDANGKAPLVGPEHVRDDTRAEALQTPVSPSVVLTRSL